MKKPFSLLLVKYYRTEQNRLCIGVIGVRPQNEDWPIVPDDLNTMSVATRSVSHFEEELRFLSSFKFFTSKLFFEIFNIVCQIERLDLFKFKHSICFHHSGLFFNGEGLLH